jgi:hypothetical protein
LSGTKGLVQAFQDHEKGVAFRGGEPSKQSVEVEGGKRSRLLNGHVGDELGNG